MVAAAELVSSLSTVAAPEMSILLMYVFVPSSLVLVVKFSTKATFFTMLPCAATTVILFCLSSPMVRSFPSVSLA